MMSGLILLSFFFNDFTMILFTVDSDPTDPAVGNFVKKNQDIQELCESCGGRSFVLNIKDKQQIPQLLETVEKISVYRDKSYCYTMYTFGQAQLEKMLQQEKFITQLAQNRSTAACKYFLLLLFEIHLYLNLSKSRSPSAVRKNRVT
uniref:AIG1-type G domain-containing protein n=1 Tax=Maylandia zebra TaxID=106582 RepID=A0A3P9DSV1_9CICH